MDSEEPLDNAHEVDLTALGKEATEKFLHFGVIGKIHKVIDIQADG
jgi:hypothetical protein